MDHVNIIYLLIGALLSYISQWVGLIIEERRSALKTAKTEPDEVPKKDLMADPLRQLQKDLMDKHVVQAGEGVYYMQPNEKALEEELKKGNYSTGGVTVMDETHERSIDRNMEDDDYETDEESEMRLSKDERE